MNRFALDPATAVRNMRLTFASNLPSVASISGMTITISFDWMRQHPGDVGLLTHELTLVVEAYPSGAPAWFASGMADYTRSVYGPADDDEWSLPDSVQSQASYTQGSGVAGRFLLWLEQHTTLNIVDQLNHALQTKQSFSAVFRRLTHHTVDQLWGQYRAHPDIMLTPQQLYKTITSRKPLYQSPLHVQLAILDTYLPIFAHGLYVSNFAIQADMTIVSGDGGGFIFRNDIKHNANERLRVSPDGTYDLVNQTVMLASDSSSAIKQGLNQTNKLAIIARKHTIYVYINSQFITKVDDSSTSYGAVGGLAIDWGNAADVRFENIQVF